MVVSRGDMTTDVGAMEPEAAALFLGFQALHLPCADVSKKLKDIRAEW